MRRRIWFPIWTALCLLLVPSDVQSGELEAARVARILRRLQGWEQTMANIFVGAPYHPLQFPECAQGTPAPLYPSDSFYKDTRLNVDDSFNFYFPDGTNPLIDLISWAMFNSSVTASIDASNISGSDSSYNPPHWSSTYAYDFQSCGNVGELLDTAEHWLSRTTSYWAPFDEIEDWDTFTSVLRSSAEPYGTVRYYAVSEITGKWEKIDSEFSWLDIDFNPSTIFAVVDTYAREGVDGVNCECACKGSSCPAGKTDFELGSIRASISLGNRDARRPAGHIFLHAIGRVAAFRGRAGIAIGGIEGLETEIVRDWDISVPRVRQILTPLTFVDLVDVPGGPGVRYEIRFYHRPEGEPDVEGFYTPGAGALFKTIVVEDPDGLETSLRFTEIEDNVSKVTEYLWNEVTQEWSLSKGAGASVESLVTSWNPAHTERTETREIRDGDDVLVSKVNNVSYVFPWGEEQVASIEDPDGDAKTTSWSFYDVAGNGYSRLKSRINPDGSWIRYVYDASGRLINEITPIGQQAITTPDEQCRVTTYAYAGNQKTISVTIGNQEVERRYLVGEGTNHEKEIVCTQAGAAVDAATNLVTETFYTAITGAKNVSTVHHPDGTLTIYDYGFDANSNPVTTVYHGAANATRTAVVAGQKTETVTDPKGKWLAERTYDIASTLLLTEAVATAWSLHGNPTHIDYDDQTAEITEYVACCGQAGSRTNREGITTSYTYDALGNVETETRAGITLTYTSDPLGRRLKTEQAGGASTRTLEENHYNLAGELEWTKDALNRQTTFSETINNGRLEKTTTYPDLTTRIETYNIDGTLYTVTGTAAHPLKYEYGVDGDGLFTKEIRVGDGGAETEWVKTYRDFAGRPSKTVYPGGAFSQSFYNPVGQLVKEVDPDGVTTLYTYNASGEREKMALDFNRNGVIDDAGPDRVTQTVSSVTTRGTKTVQRTVTSMSGPNQGDGLAVVAEVDQTPNGRESWQTHFGRLTTQVTTLQPANASRTEVVTRPDLTTEVTQYDLGRPAWMEQRNQNGTKLTKTAFDYDDYGRLHTATDDRNGATVHTYTALDEILTVTTPPPEAGQAGLTTTREYQPLSRQLDWVQLPDGSKQYTTYWPTGELKKSWGSQTYTTEYTYDTQGRMKTLTTTGAAGPAVTTWTYSPTRGWLTAKTYEGGNGTTYPEYTPAGRLKQRQWQRGITTTYGYNNAGERETIVYSGGTAPSVTYGYDRRGRQNSVIDGTGTRTLSYSSDGQLEDEVYTQGTLAGLGTMRDYDGTGRRQMLTVQTLGNSLASSYGYDLGGRLETITSGQHAVAYGYEPNSALLKTTTSKRNGTAVMTATRSYDKNNRLTGITTARPTTGVIASYGYQLNSLGQRDRADLADGSSWHYTYDTLGQVTNGKRYWSDTTEVAGQQFSYLFDGIGNRTSTTTNGRTATYTPNALNQYSERTVPGAVDVLGEAAPGATVTVNTTATARKNGYYYKELPVSNSEAPVHASVNVHAEASGQSMDKTGHVFVAKAVEVFSHDLDGNQTGDGRWTYTWDAENRLIAVETKAVAITAGVPKQRLEFAYDDRWRRVSKKIYGWNATNSDWELTSEIRFLYDGWNLVAELGGSNNLLRSYVWGLDLSQTLGGAGGVGGLISETHYPATGPASYFPTYDGNGNIVALVKTTDGRPRAQYEYGPFGETVRATGSMAELNPFTFSTKYQDHTTGLLYYGHRYCRSTLGRWLNRDPIAEKGGLNLYGMVGNDVVNRWDYLGLLVSITYVKDANDNNKGCVTVTDQDTGATHKYFAFSTPALPDGKYEVLERAGKKSYYRLEANDAAFGDDKAEMAGQARTNLRFHKVSGSAGCIACQKDDHANWDKAEEIILKTKTSTKEVIMKGFSGIFGSKETLVHYGTLTVSTAKKANEK